MNSKMSIAPLFRVEFKRALLPFQVVPLVVGVTALAAISFSAPTAASNGLDAVLIGVGLFFALVTGLFAFGAPKYQETVLPLVRALPQPRWIKWGVTYVSHFLAYLTVQVTLWGISFALFRQLFHFELDTLLQGVLPLVMVLFAAGTCLALIIKRAAFSIFYIGLIGWCLMNVGLLALHFTPKAVTVGRSTPLDLDLNLWAAACVVLCSILIIQSVWAFGLEREIFRKRAGAQSIFVISIVVFTFVAFAAAESGLITAGDEPDEMILRSVVSPDGKDMVIERSLKKHPLLSQIDFVEVATGRTLKQLRAVPLNLSHSWRVAGKSLVLFLSSPALPLVPPVFTGWNRILVYSFSGELIAERHFLLRNFVDVSGTGEAVAIAMANRGVLDVSWVGPALAGFADVLETPVRNQSPLPPDWVGLFTQANAGVLHSTGQGIVLSTENLLPDGSRLPQSLRVLDPQIHELSWAADEAASQSAPRYLIGSQAYFDDNLAAKALDRKYPGDSAHLYQVYPLTVSSLVDFNDHDWVFRLWSSDGIERAGLSVFDPGTKRWSAIASDVDLTDAQIGAIRARNGSMSLFLTVASAPGLGIVAYPSRQSDRFLVNLIDLKTGQHYSEPVKGQMSSVSLFRMTGYDGFLVALQFFGRALDDAELFAYNPAAASFQRIPGVPVHLIYLDESGKNIYVENSSTIMIAEPGQAPRVLWKSHN